MSYDPAPPSGPPQFEPSQPGRTVPLAVGGLIGMFLAGGSGVLGLVLMSTTQMGAMFFVGPGLAVALGGVLTSQTATRWWGIGLLVGFFGALIVLGGACVAIIASLGGI